MRTYMNLKNNTTGGVNADMKKNRDQWEAIMSLAENKEDISDNSESLIDISGDDDIQVKLDVIGDLLEDIRDDLKEQEKRQLGLTSNIKSDKFNSISRFDNSSFAIMSGKPALVLLSSDENKVTVAFLGSSLILIKA